MALQYSTTVRNAKLDAVESAAGTSAILKVFTGAVPANCAASDPGTVLATCNLPADWMANAANGTKSLQGTWSGSASATGTAGHFRIFASDGSTCHIQGTVTINGSGGDMTVDNTSFATGQSFNVNSFTLTAGNA